MPDAEKDALVEAVEDLCWRAQRYGATEDGDTAYYLVTKGAMHRLVAACPGAAFRSDDSATIPDQGATSLPSSSRTTEHLYGLRQVWCVVYDSPTPSMDGGAHPIRMADQDLEIALRNYEFMERQQRVSPKRNLRIETRWVSDYTDVTTTVLPPGVGA